MIKRTSLLAVSAVAALAQTIPFSSLRAADDTAEKKDQAAPTAPALEKKVEIKDPVAVVNGEKITVKQLDEALNNALSSMGGNAAALPQEQRIEFYRRALEGMIAEKLVTQAAAKEEVTQADIDAEIKNAKAKFPSEEEFNKYLTQMGQSPEKLAAFLKPMIQQQRWMMKQIEGKANVDDATAKKFYDDNKDQFKQPETVKASHILVRVEKDAPEATVNEKLEVAKKAADRVKTEDFAVVAKEVSEDPGSKENGGDLGYFPKDAMVPEFAEVAFKEKVGEVSAPVRTDFGWHIIKVTDKKEARAVPYDEAKDNLIAYLKENEQQKAIQEVITKLRSSAKIENNLPPSKEQ